MNIDDSKIIFNNKYHRYLNILVLKIQINHGTHDMVIDDERKSGSAEAEIVATSEEKKARILVRPESVEDIRDIYYINSRAFGRDDEGELVDKLRGKVSPYISLVAENGGHKAGHILFTPVTIKDSSLKAAGLGPMAVPARISGAGHRRSAHRGWAV